MELNQTYTAEIFFLEDDGTFPNNNRLPVIHYKNVLDLHDGKEGVRKLFEENNWKNSWDSGIYTDHHYHSNTHEVLGAYDGKSNIMVGGDKAGKTIVFEKGDVLIIPAGVAHKNLESENSVKCIGAYPDGREYDMKYGKDGERPETDNNIKAVPLPEKDPVFGSVGELKDHWRRP